MTCVANGAMLVAVLASFLTVAVASIDGRPERVAVVSPPARNVSAGAPPGATSEVLTHLAFYAGWPNVFSALPVVKEVFEKCAN